MFSFTPILKNAETSKPPRESLGGVVCKFFKALGSRKSLFLFPGMMVIGIAIGFYANNLGNVNEEIAKHNGDKAVETVGLIFILLAVGEISAGAIVGRLADKFSKLKVYHAMLLVPEIGLALTALAYYFRNYSTLVISGYAWGFTDTALNSIVGVVIGSYFGGALEYFCLMRFFTGMGAAAGSLLSLVFNGDAGTWYYIAVVAGALVFCHAMFLLTKDDKIEAKKGEEVEPLTKDENAEPLTA